MITNPLDLVSFNLIYKALKAAKSGGKIARWIFTISSLLLLSGLAVILLVQLRVFYSVLWGWGLGFGILGFIGLAGLSLYQSVQEETEARAEIQKVADKAEQHPNEPTAAWQLARIKLENYLNRNLAQVRWIFGCTVMVMLAGFVLIGVGIVNAYTSKENLNPSLITVVSGVLIEFIGATFLVIYKSSMQQAKEYVDVLERINAVGMSVQILESVSNADDRLQDKTKAEIAKLLLSMYSPSNQKARNATGSKKR